MKREELLKGAYDLHVHTAPDVVKRKFDDYEFCERLIASEMSGGIIKSHYFDTSARAQLLNKKYPKLNIGGGIVLNNSVGGLNPYAVEKAAKLGAKIIWMPTMDSYSYEKVKNIPNKNLEKYIYILDKDENLKKEIYDILEIAKENKIFIATGHISSFEGLKLIKEANKFGVKTIITHADNPNDLYTVEEQKEAVSLGAMIEHAYFTVFHARTNIEEIARQIREVGHENVFLTTDFGQMNSPYPDEGLLEFAEKLLRQNFTETELRKMIVENPKYIINFR